MTSNIHPSVANGITIVSSFRTRRQVARKRGAYTDSPVTSRKERESRLPGCRFQNGIIGRLRWVAFGATVWGNRGTLAPDSCRVSRPRSLASPRSSPPFLLPCHRSLSLSFFPTTYLCSLFSLSLPSLFLLLSFVRCSVPLSLSLSLSPSRFQVIRKYLFLSPPYAVRRASSRLFSSLARSFLLRFHKQRASLGLHMCIREASICMRDWLTRAELGILLIYFGARPLCRARWRAVDRRRSIETCGGRLQPRIAKRSIHGWFASSPHSIGREIVRCRRGKCDFRSRSKYMCVYIYIFILANRSKNFVSKFVRVHLDSFRYTRGIFMKVMDEFF